MKPSYEGSARALAGRGIGRVSRWRLFGEARSCRIVRSFRCWSERIFRTMEQRTRITMHVFTAVLVPSESSPTRIAREQSHSPVIASVRGMKTSREEGRERQRTLDAAMSRRADCVHTRADSERITLVGVVPTSSRSCRPRIALESGDSASFARVTSSLTGRARSERPSPYGGALE